MTVSGWRTHAVGAGAVGALFALGVILGVMPVLDRQEISRDLVVQRADLSARLDAARAEERSVREELVGLQQLGAGWAEERARQGSLNQSMARLAEVAAASGISLDTLSAGTANRLALFEVTPISVGGRGGYAESARFMSEVLAAMPNVTVERFELDAGPDGAGGRVSVTFAWYDDGAGAGAGPTGGSG